MKEPSEMKGKILKNKFLPLILMALNIAFFFFILPINIAQNYSIFFAIIGGVITLILSFWLFGALTPNLYDRFPIFMGLFCISTLFIFAFMFIVMTVDYAEEELGEFGVYTEAIIIDKTKIYGKRGRSTQNIDVEFITEENIISTAKILVTESHYNYLQEGMTIPIIYSSKHPNIAEIDLVTLGLR